ncbi:MAG: methionine--tRNA ligase subunit beta, partial [Planctomycetes bacterium]|nr:methionine--tRNA ligase subunit beta [Planctomycetota bacterium]
LSRVSKLIGKNFEGVIPDPGDYTAAEQVILESAAGIGEKVQQLIEKLRLNEAIEETLQFIRGVNRYLEQTAPWKLIREDKSAAGRVLYTAAEALRIGAILLNPVMPNRTATVLEVLNTSNSDLIWGGLTPGNQLQEHEALFPRIDIKKQAAEKPASELLENVITIDDFVKVELRTAEVLEAEKVEGADRLLKLQVQIGEEKRQIVAGIAQFYTPADLIGKFIVVVYNLQPVKIRGIESRGMLLAAKKKKRLSLIVLDKPEIGSGASIS